jgi:AcrR family transcriptional regulator
MLPDYKESVRQRIIETAYVVIGEKGLNAMSLDDVASRMGVSKAALYGYFKNKDALIHAIFETSQKEFETIVSNVFGGTDSQNWAETFFDLLFGEHAINIKIYFEFIFESFHDEQFKALFQADTEQHLDLIEALIAREQRENRVPSNANPREISQDLLVITFGIMTSFSFGMDLATLKAIWLRSIDRLLS